MNERAFPNIATFVSFLVCTVAVQAGAAGEPRWATLGGSFQRTGLSSFSGPTTGGIVWKFETGGAVVGSVTVGSEGQIHVACEDGKLYTLGSDGRPMWVLDVNCPLVSTPTIGADGRVFVGGKDGRLFAIASDGRVLWTFRATNAIYAAPAVGADGHVYVGSTDGTIYALGQDGAELWRFKTKGPGTLPRGAVFASPTLGVDGTVYVAGLYDPNLYALKPADGSVKWACRFPASANDSKTGGWPFASPVVGPDGRIYQTLLYDQALWNAGGFHAIDPSTGRISWSVGWDVRPSSLEQASPLSGDSWSEPVLAPNGTIYLSCDDPGLRACVSGGGGWVKPFGDVGAFTLTVDKNNVVYAASDDGYVYVVASNGTLITQFETGGWPVFPVLAADGVLILADSKDYSMLEPGARNAVWAISAESVQKP